ncbi:Retrovirus-related Pol polyprotein like [Argiope bruennichi]|uniref:Retrovirus-related Pol polyprotein like n=1 Tax=Argiope bruennichi TaxID=94029 RepID=A0A8T0DZT5_ARGBR|nr:Retrovirus-related Pol polyprotein like [Argiope bruennichi]
MLAEKGIALTLSVPYKPEQNGVAERENRTIVELALSMLAASALPRSLWANACDTAVYLLNHTGLSPDESKSPHELWTGEPKTKLDHLKVFGTECYAHIPKIFRSKFEDKSVHGHFLGYVNKKDGYKIYLPSRKKIIKSRDVDFKPERLCTTPVTVEVEEDLNERYEETRSEERNLFEEQEPVRKSGRIRSSPAWMKSGEYLMANIAAVEEFENSENPSTYSETLSSSESELWLEAMKEEIKALHENETWELVERPKGSKVINCRWVLRKKYNSDGTVERHKARLVAKGYAQKAGFDYDETFSPVARYDTLRAVLAVAAKENLYLKQFDVKTEFLYGTLKEEVFMTQPEDFNDNTGRVCKLHKSLYGLKQAPRCWNQCFVNFMNDQELKVSIWTVRAVLESLPPPEIVAMTGELESLRTRIERQLKEIVNHRSWIMPGFNGFMELDESVYSDEFQELARRLHGLPWAVWKEIAITHLIHLAMTVYFRGTQRQWNVEQWKKMGELVLEAIYSSYSPNTCFSKQQECVICTQPVFHEVTMTSGHAFHSSCLERWMFEDVK